MGFFLSQKSGARIIPAVSLINLVQTKTDSHKTGIPGVSLEGSLPKLRYMYIWNIESSGMIENTS